jgi:Protein-tyrosine-phosphatase
MAEGILRACAGETIRVESAGSAPTGQVHPFAVKVMNEIGIDISDHRSKHLSEFLDTPVHTVISVCGNADQACPIFPGMKRRYHWAFDDPAKVEASENQVLSVFRNSRDEIARVFGAYAAGLQMGNDHV